MCLHWVSFGLFAYHLTHQGLLANNLTIQHLLPITHAKVKSSYMIYEQYIYEIYEQCLLIQTPPLLIESIEIQSNPNAICFHLSA